MTINIIGNGRSRSLFKAGDAFDLTIGCNLPMEGIHHDYVAAVDSSAITNFYRPVNDSMYHRLCEEGFKLILGPRCVSGLSTVKAKAGGSEALIDFLRNEGHIHCEIDNTSLIEQSQIGQRYFSSGHLAFQYAVTYHPDETIHLYGFDSLFTGFHDSYTADYIYRTDTSKLKSQYNPKEPSNTAINWFVIWQKVMNYYIDKYEEVIIHGPHNAEYDIPAFFKHTKTKYMRHDV